MSDLIEKLNDERANVEHLPEYCLQRVPLTLRELDTILSALKTVRGIEEAKRILIEWDEEVKVWRVNTYTSEGWQSGTTLAAAVEAAGKKGDGRDV